MTTGRKQPTRTPPESARGATSLPTPLAAKTGLALPAADAVVALRVVGSDVPDIALSPLKKRFLLGSDMGDPDVSLKISSRMNGDPNAKEIVSRVHLLIQRHGSELAIRDQGSTNGTFIEDRKVATDIHITAGKTFRVADVTLLAMDEQMVLLRPDLQWVLGFRAHAYVDEMLTLIAAGGPLLLLGEPACEQRWLAEQIHCTSARRHDGFVAVPAPLAAASSLAGATGGTAFIDLADFKRGADRLSAPFVNELFGATYRVRPIVAAPDLKTAVANLGDRAHQLEIVTLPPVRERREDVPRILSSLFRRPPLESSATIARLKEHQIEALKAFRWPDNFDDLRRNAPRLLALVKSDGNKAAAARLLGVKVQSLSDALKRLGL